VIGFCTSPRFVLHQTGPGHPERPERIAAIFQAVRAAGLVRSPNPLPELSVPLGPFTPAGFKLVELEPRPAERQWLETVHPAEHIDRIQHICQMGGVLDQGDTPVGRESYNLALLSAGAALTCCDAVIDGRVARAFSAGRPPGHHAEPAAAMGFCLFSNIAIAARYLQKRHGVGKVAIVDFDVHHGNGTQAALESDPSVLFISIHQDPRTCYPGSGYEWEIGVGPGRGFTMNIPMPPGVGDAEYLAEFDGKILPKLDEFKPEFLLLSAGFDAHAQDPLASVQLSEEGFGQITRRMVSVAKNHCGGRIVSALEGGYHLGALTHSLVRHLVELADGG
jgi:acetoin utilization deacetylase AcuC-like enzyme